MRGLLMLAALCAPILSAGCRYTPVGLGESKADPQLHDWQRVESTLSPGETWYPAAVFDPERGNIVIYGGGPAYTYARDDMWQFDGTDWSQICAQCGPGPRFNAAFVYDAPKGRLLLFGGSGIYRPPDYLADLWAFEAGQWRALSSSGGTPSPRTMFAHAYDTSRDTLVIFGGQREDGSRTDQVYELSSGIWRGPYLPSLRPGPREMATAVMSEAHGGILVYGGLNGDAFDDMWLWKDEQWTLLCDPCTGTARGAAGIGELPGSGELIIVAGWDGGDEIAGTWRGDATGFVRWSTLPAKRDSFSMTYDPERNYFLLFGGNGDSCRGDCDDTYILRVTQP